MAALGSNSLFYGWNNRYAGKPDTQAGVMQRYEVAQEAFGGNSFAIKNTGPICFRKLLEAQLSHESKARKYAGEMEMKGERGEGRAGYIQPRFNRLGDDRSVRIKAFFAGTLGAAFSAAYRIVRIALWTGLLPLTILHHVGKASRYGISNNVREHIGRYFDEWKDLGVTAGCVFIGLCKTLKPDAFTNATNCLATYYFKRFDSRNLFDTKVNTSIAQYDALKKRALEDRRTAAAQRNVVAGPVPAVAERT